VYLQNFDFVSQITRVEEGLKALWINVASKIGPKGTNTCKACQTPWFRMIQQEATEDKWGPAKLTTTIG